MRQLFNEYQNKLDNEQIVKDMVNHIYPKYSVDFTEYKYERWDATVRDESGKIRAYIESKVRYLKSTQHRSAIVGKAKKALTKLNDAPVLVISWYKQDDKVYVFPFVQNGKLSPYIIEDQQYLILPEEQSWVYSYKNRNLELLSYPPKTA